MKVTARRITSNDVARLAGVNQSTVSRVFSGDSKISGETRERVLTAADQLAYTPNAIARSLITQQTRMVGVVMTGITSPFQPYVLERLIRQFQLLGRQVLVFSAGAEQDVDELLPIALQYQVDALVVTSATLSSRRLAECSRRGMPVVLFNRYVQDRQASAVCCDNLAGGRTVADLLLDAGHRRLAYVAGNPDSSTNRDREAGFTGRVRERAGQEVRRVQAAYTYESGREAGDRLLALADPPDAVFCASDITALGFMDRARELGLAIPDDLALVGFDDIPMAAWSAYSLTTVRQPVDVMIEATAEVVLAQVETPEATPELRLFEGTLVERGSTR